MKIVEGRYGLAVYHSEELHLIPETAGDCAALQRLYDTLMMMGTLVPKALDKRNPALGFALVPVRAPEPEPMNGMSGGE